MSILAWVLVGLVAGWAADELMRGDSFGILGNMIVGIVGALIGGFLATNVFGMGDALTGFNLTTVIVAFLGAVLLLGVMRMFRRSRV